MQDQYDDQFEEVNDGEAFAVEDETVSRRPSLITIVIIVVLVISVVAMLLWPAISVTTQQRYAPTPTPTPNIWQIANKDDVRVVFHGEGGVAFDCRWVVPYRGVCKTVLVTGSKTPTAL